MRGLVRPKAMRIILAGIWSVWLPFAAAPDAASRTYSEYGSRDEVKELVRARYLMGTVCEITAYGDESRSAITLAFDEIGRLESILSTFLEESELSRINREAHARPLKVSEDLWNVLLRSVEIARLSSGAFDPSYASPPAARGIEKVTLDSRARTVRLAPGTRLNFGGIAKGYALDAAAVVLRKEGVESALLNFGGQILALGAPPGEDAWPVEIASPLCAGKAGGVCAPAITMRVRDLSLSTSGLSERPGHILDPRTGMTLSGARSVTVIGRSAADADAWSTALFVLGLAEAPAGFSDCAIGLSSGRAGGIAAALIGDCPEDLAGFASSFKKDSVQPAARPT